MCSFPDNDNIKQVNDNLGKKYGKNVVISIGDSQIATGEISTER